MKKPLVLHTFLFAIYPIIFLFAINVSELSIREIYIPMLISFLAFLIVFFFINFIFKNIYKSGFVTTILILIFFLYGHIIGYLESSGIIISRHREYQLFLGILIALGYIIYFVKNSCKKFVITNNMLNIVAVVLIGFNAVNILAYQIKINNLDIGQFISSGFINTNNSINNEQKPDIYFILLDEYANSKTMKDIFNYDNSEFEKYLKSKGFYIIEDSMTHASYTPKIMASILNMEEIENGDLNLYFQLIRNNKVVKYLKERDYKVINFPIRYYEDYVSPITGADYTFKSPQIGIRQTLGNFNYELILTTILRIFIEQSRDEQNYYAISTNYIFDTLETIPTNYKSPKFVYAHVEAPHPPYVFDEYGNDIGINWDGNNYYLGQYKYVTKRAKDVVDLILEKSQIPPIIIILSDHGPNQKSNGNSYFATNPIHTYNIFSAMYLPNYENNNFYNSISPVDTFKLIFNIYFGDKFDLMED